MVSSQIHGIGKIGKKVGRSFGKFESFFETRDHLDI